MISSEIFPFFTSPILTSCNSGSARLLRLLGLLAASIRVFNPSNTVISLFISACVFASFNTNFALLISSVISFLKVVGKLFLFSASTTLIKSFNSFVSISSLEILFSDSSFGNSLSSFDSITFPDTSLLSVLTFAASSTFSVAFG